MRRVLGATAAGVAIGLTAWAAPAHAAIAFKSCDDATFRCARVSVPLDRSGTQPGTVRLFVKRARTRAKRPASPLVLFAGGPGQSASRAFGQLGGSLAAVLRKRDVIVFDQRGTGRSGLLRCRQLEKANILRARSAAAACAAGLGPRRAFYTSRDTADDLEQIRVALGVPKLSLYGVSYGTRTALSYAQRYPARVDRMSLSSVVAPDGVDAFGRDTFAAVPRVLRSLCSGGACRVATKDVQGDVARLVRTLSARPLRGRVVSGSGKATSKRLSSRDALNVLVSGDFDPQLRSEFPGAVARALDGDAAPMLRLVRRSDELEGGALDPRDLSAAVYAATTCEEASLPWVRTAPFGQRLADAGAAANTIAPAALAPFDRATALASDTIDLCREWPAAPAAPVPGPGPLPNVPTLLLEGNDDLRTPLESAIRLARQLPRATVVSVAGVGHDPEGQAASACAERLTPAFFNGGKLPRRCTDYRARGATPPPPARLSSVKPIRGIRGARGRALGAARLTLADAIDDILFVSTAQGDGASVLRRGGLRGGRYAYDVERGTVVMRSFSFVPGVRVSGRIKAFGTRKQRGSVRVGGTRGGRGALVVRGQAFRGTIGGRRVSGRLNIATASVATAASARTPTRPLIR